MLGITFNSACALISLKKYQCKGVDLFMLYDIVMSMYYCNERKSGGNVLDTVRWQELRLENFHNMI